MTATVEVTELCKSYGATPALDGVSFSVGPGQAVALLGPNGSGKTTAIRCVAGLTHPDSGSVRVCGMDLRRHTRETRRHFAYVPQHASFPGNVTVQEVLRFHATLRRLNEHAVAAALEEAGLAQESERMVGELSGGMRQRLSLAVAGIPPVSLMLLDEPTASLDPKAALRLRQLVGQWRDEGRSILFSTHVLSDAEELADRVVVMVEGKVVRDENVARLRADLQQYALLRVDVGQPTPAHQRAAYECGATHVHLNSTALVITAPVERRYAILDKLRQLGGINHFETEGPSIEHLYVEYAEGKHPRDI